MQKKRIFPIILGVWLVLSACPALAGMPGTEKWYYDRGGRLAVGPDGTVYVTHYSGTYFTAITPAGAYRWEFSASPTTVTSFPVIGEGGTVYFGGGLGQFWAFPPEGGAPKWQDGFGLNAIGESAIGAGGYIYLAYGDMVRIRPDGAVDKTFEPPGGGVCTPPAIGPDGTIYVGDNNGNLYARNPDLTEKWTLIGAVYYRYLR